MRKIPPLATLALTAGVHAAAWTALPRAAARERGTVSGDGTAVVFMNYLGGTSMHQPSSSVAPWIKLQSDAKSKSVVVRKIRSPISWTTAWSTEPWATAS
ncbi:MAG: hypothetical protein IPN71_02240 [Fibrobacteres bacterium]|nr:hypothetical protein [Fibrobacterota bacterium]